MNREDYKILIGAQYNQNSHRLSGTEVANIYAEAQKIEQVDQFISALEEVNPVLARHYRDLEKEKNLRKQLERSVRA